MHDCRFGNVTGVFNSRTAIHGPSLVGGFGCAGVPWAGVHRVVVNAARQTDNDGRCRLLLAGLLSKSDRWSRPKRSACWGTDWRDVFRGDHACALQRLSRFSIGWNSLPQSGAEHVAREQRRQNQ